MPMKLESVIFDMDGLLVDSERLYLQAFNEVADAYGLTDAYEFFLSTKVKCAVATSSSAENAYRKLRSNDILNYFMTVTCGDEVENSKPHPEIYIKSAKSINANPSCSIALEDSENGVRSAVAAGFHVIQVPDLLPPSAELLILGHDVCNNLFDAKIRIESLVQE